MPALFDSLSAAPACAGHRPGLLPRLGHALAVRRQRRRLAALDARALADIGLTPEQARAESCRPVWDVPAWWRR